MEKMWFYAQGTNRQGPVPESEIKSLVASGVLAMTDLAWTEGMANWAAISALPNLHPTAAAVTAPEAPASDVKPAVEPTVAPPAHPTAPVRHPIPESLPGWLGFIGVLNIVWGVFSVLSCIGAITGIFLILSGVALMGARTALEGVQGISPDLVPFFDKLKTYATTTGVLYVLGLVIGLLMLVFYIVLFAGLAKTALGH